MKSFTPLNWISPVLCLLVFEVVLPAWAGSPATAALGDDVVGEVESGNLEAAAQKLSQGNYAAKGTVAWYHQSAMGLLGRAEQLLASGETKAGQRVAAAAIQIMKQGARKRGANTGAGDQAQLYVQIAQTYDHFLGDRASARQHYLLALNEVPDLPEAEAALAAYDAEAARVQEFVRRGN